MYLDSFTDHFSDIEDPRQTAKVAYPLFDILFATLCAIIAGAEGWSDIQEYTEGHHDWFLKQGMFKEGVPVDDTIARVLSRIKPEQFNLCFINWMRSVHQLTKGELVAIDGKVLRGSYHREDRYSTLHMVSAYAAANQLVIGQVRTQSKSNEITAIPELIKLLELKGALISIDAMGCQTQIARDIIEAGADYLLSVKDNQKNLHRVVREALAGQLSGSLTREKVHIEQGHGRIEIRQSHVMDASSLVAHFPEWPELKTVGVTVGYRQEKGKSASLEYRYAISSAELTEEQFAQAIRSHWQIENNLHWILDVSFREDDCKIYRKNAAENIAILRRVALNMLKKETTKLSIRMKRKRAWMKIGFLEQVLQAGFSGLDDI
ncbi:H repeat-associated protein yhhI [Xenorhabdus poinarii G6]|uniref:H repeat-associated protein yhhI n=1 Tax=Xenorhabdus poinarii G6 TaxID=1354304 RepID=A0A068R3F7_9GAMM|nr:ISAs1 family transposase [Xenorhabdus poinarii]CDG21777.1 H repeat-associated protein yhhI [Xenorhabdus poinarii G6]